MHSGLPNFDQSFKAFEETDELRARYEFLSHTASRLMGVTSLQVLCSTLADSSIPDLADWCWVGMREEGASSWKRLASAFRFSEETALGKGLEKSIFEGALPFSSAVSDAKSFFLKDAPVGIWFLMTGSQRKFDEKSLRLIEEFVVQAEEACRWAVAQDQLQKQVNRHDEMISIASHELKTPLAAMRLALDIVKREAGKHSDSVPMSVLNRVIRTFDRSIGTMSQSIEMLFNVSEIRTGKFQVLRQMTDVSELLTDLLSRMESLLVAADCKLQGAIQSGIMAEIDPRRVEQAVINLLGNAAKYAPKALVEVSLSEGENFIEICVRDHGPGIPENERAQIFQAFRRANEKQTVDGLGLGLYITQGVVQAHEGEITLTSEVGKGTEFLIRLPSVKPL